MKLSSDEIKKILPHRYPFLMVDKIIDMEPGKWAKGIKCVSAGEHYFTGHFPERQVMPGVLIMEALAQTGAVALLSQPENRGKLAVFGGIQNCRFKQQVVPGDVLELYCELTAFRGPVGYGKCTARVDDRIVAMGEITFALTN